MFATGPSDVSEKEILNERKINVQAFKINVQFPRRQFCLSFKRETEEESFRRFATVTGSQDFYIKVEDLASAMKWIEGKTEGAAPAARGGHAGVSLERSCYYFGGADR